MKIAFDLINIPGNNREGFQKGKNPFDSTWEDLKKRAGYTNLEQNSFDNLISYPEEVLSKQ